MSPKQIGALRGQLELSQEELAETLGVARLSMSQYETGFRRPGPTLTIVLHVLDTLPKGKALELIALLNRSAKIVGRKKIRPKT
jgi:DNA-binding XRE family transcriptional regulator